MPCIRPRSLALLASTIGSLAVPAAASETRGYVVNWFVNSSYSQEGDCPDGPNWSVAANINRILKTQGKTDAEIAAMSKLPVQALAYGVLPNRGRIDGKPVNAYLNPTSVPDPGAHVMQGKVSLGFNLDGKDGDQSFTDPESGEHGVDNQLFRVLGCFTPQRATPPDLASLGVADWDMVRDAMPAWLIEISGIDDPQNDDDVQVGVYRALERANRDSSGDIRADNTYRVDPDPRSINHVHGKIKDGVLWTDQAPSIHLVGDPFGLAEYNFQQARLRLDMKDPNAQKGIIGGYHEWKPIYWHYGSAGWVVEHSSAIEIPGVYYGLKKYADAVPDPKTGENTAISISYIVETVPAFVIHSPDENKVADAGQATKTAQQ